MDELWLVASIGHCGTLWLSRVLDSMPHIRCYHELKYRLCRSEWPELVQREAEQGTHAEILQPYWDQLARDMLEHNIVCDVNSWHPLGVPASTRVFVIVRNGITQLHSLYTKSRTWRELPLNHYVFTDMIEQYADTSIYKLDRWGRMCALWAGVVDRMEEVNSARMEMFRFEDLVRGDTLSRFVPGISVTEIRTWQAHDINRKVRGDRSADAIFAQWTQEMRDIFVELCKDSMGKLGYHIPGLEGHNA